MADLSSASTDVRSAPDLMNDPQYATNIPGGDDGMGDADTCRICRGEGSGSEPLFHPCKCSGSIKYVHQDCLMEWLSHSQKKHCELCKTAFRFTKLYSPNMPQTLPYHVLFRHIVIHTAKNVGIWLRFCVVVTVWLGFLPYIIRQVWRLLFWFSDGGWPSNYNFPGTNRNTTSEEALEIIRELHQLASITSNETSPVSPLQASQTSPASVSGVMSRLTNLLLPLSQTINSTIPDPLAAGFFKSIIYGFGSQLGQENTDNANSALPGSFASLSPRHESPSLLSEVSFLRNLTRSSHVNQLVITVTEGYVITVVVVICFILVFLIREWVVQQQPGINMGAGFNAEFAVPERPREQAIQEREQDPAPRLLLGADIQGNRPEPREADHHPVARPRHLDRRQRVEDGAARLQQADALHRQDQRIVAEETTSIYRPSPVRDALSPAAEIQRRLEEPIPDVEFMDLWQRAGENPEEVLRIIERENKGDEMRYWVNSMKILQHPPSSSAQGSLTPYTAWPAQSALTQHRQRSDRAGPGATRRDNSEDAHLESDGNSAGSDGWVDVSPQLTDRNSVPLNQQPGSQPALSNHSSGKGKGKTAEVTFSASSGVYGSGNVSSSSQLKETNSMTAQNCDLTTPQPIPAEDSEAWSSWTTQKPFVASRPRAVSDGPQPRDTISPLANNNWTFSNIPESISSRIPEGSFHRGTYDHSSTESDLSIPPQPSGLSGATAIRDQDAILQVNRDEVGPASDSDEADLDSDLEGPANVMGLDGVSRTHANWDEVDANDIVNAHDPPPRQTDPGLEDELPAREPVPAPQPQPQGLLANLAELLWGGIGEVRVDDQGANDEHVVDDLVAEPPFVPVNNGLREEDADIDEQDQDQEVVEAAIAAGIDPNDQDAIDDAEDFEGIMELVGMRGPLFSLIQNALFSAFLLALTVAFGAWIPYNIGRVSLLLLANPGPAFKLPLRLVFGCAAFLQDLALSLAGAVSYCLIALISLPVTLWSSFGSSNPSSFAMQGLSLGSAALGISHSALDRILDGIIKNLIYFTDSEILPFSAASHEALITIQSLLLDSLSGLVSRVIHLSMGDYRITMAGCYTATIELSNIFWNFIYKAPAFVARPDSWVISLALGKRITPLDLELSTWSSADRFWATVAGYTAISIFGALYVRKGSPFSTSQIGREWEATIIDLLNQAGGVMKVILIISIEMLVFPLYCGLLLDAALLPLFENTTITSRSLFTIKSPLTSIFIHWFVGTCYMFHFALFVSMCRKIMRKGVLYFIRDPDDPTFHPVRDVLERNVATQLRKILFSALVYGALVVVCLGGVVWGLAFTFKGVLPIHWSSNEPVLEFPVDLLFYNFLMPLAVKFFKPSDGLHAMYSWWFRRCARMLRLTWFLFDERKPDEEGFHVRRTWGDVFRGAKGDTFFMVKVKDRNEPFVQDPALRAYFHMDGRYVRAPASDQVRIPKDTKVFVEVDEFDNRNDKEENADSINIQQPTLFKQVYIPPWFRVRIFLFILSIWIFAALTGVSITIVPLVFGRHVFAKMIPPHVRKNDVYAFSIGIYILGSGLYAVVHLGKFINYIRSILASDASTPSNVLQQIRKIAVRVASFIWTYTAFLCFLPTLFAFLVELYLILPLHTYFAVGEPHVVHFVQSWTLGLLYLKLTTRIILWYEDSRPARSLRAITRDGYLNPNAWLATRGFILPAAFVLGLALLIPWAMATITVSTLLKHNPEKHTLAYRYAYPMCLCLLLIGFANYVLLGWLKEWRMKIKDEVYLIGERLHNFGERKGTNVVVPGVRRLET